MEKKILNFHFDYLHPSLRFLSQNEVKAILGEFVNESFQKLSHLLVSRVEEKMINSDLHPATS